MAIWRFGGSFTCVLFFFRHLFEFLFLFFSLDDAIGM